MRKGSQRGMTLVETMVGALVLAVCAAPLLGSVAWIRSRAADAAIDAEVANELNEQIALVQSTGRATSLIPSSASASTILENGVTVAMVTTVAAVGGVPKLFDVSVVGTWTSRGEGGRGRSMTLETYVFSPDN